MAAPGWWSLSKPQEPKCTNDHMTLKGDPELHTWTLNRDLRMPVHGDCGLSCHTGVVLSCGVVGLCTQPWTQGSLKKKKIQQSQRTDQGMAESQMSQREEETELWSAHTSPPSFIQSFLTLSNPRHSLVPEVLNFT